MIDFEIIEFRKNRFEFWFMEYRVNGKTGYAYTWDDSRDLSNFNIESLADKPHISECCACLQKIIEKVHRDGITILKRNDVDYLERISTNFMEELQADINKFGLDDNISFHEGTHDIIMFNSILTKFLF